MVNNFKIPQYMSKIYILLVDGIIIDCSTMYMPARHLPPNVFLPVEHWSCNRGEGPQTAKNKAFEKKDKCYSVVTCKI